MEVLIGYTQGEWDKNLKGIWVGKFEATVADLGVSVKPNTKSCTSDTIGNYFNIAQNFSNSSSHMLKNSEWGAVVYLSYSKYGINGKNLVKNMKYVSGNGDYINNQNQSTTANIYGVYDLSGGTYEVTASYIADNSRNYGNVFASIDNTFNNKTKSTKYSTVYLFDETNIEQKNYLKNVNIKFGDAVIETSTDGIGENAWNNSNSAFLGFTDEYKNRPFFGRGGGVFSDFSGPFCFDRSIGHVDVSVGFRIACIAE